MQIPLPGKTLLARMKQAVATIGRQGPNVIPNRSALPRSYAGGLDADGLQVGKVLSHTGASQSARYTVMLPDGTTKVGMKPRVRGAGVGQEMQVRAAPNNTPCYVSLQDVGGVPTWLLHQAEEEVDTRACAGLLGSGTPEAVITTAVEQANTPLRPPTKLSVSFALSVSSLTMNRYGQRIYSFPVGAIGIRSILADLVISSSSVTSAIEVGFGTGDATGGTLARLRGDEHDIVAATSPGSVSASLDYERFMPDARDVAGTISVRRSATHTVGTSMGDITWDTEVYKDAHLFTFSASSAEITAVVDGTFEIAYDVTCERVSGASDNAVESQLVKNGSLITGTSGLDEILGSAAGRATISKRFTVSLLAGDVIKLQAARGGGNVARIAADTSNLTIRKLPVERNFGMLYNGLSTNIDLFFNMALRSGSWNASGSVYVTGTIYIDWLSAGEFDG